MMPDTFSLTLACPAKINLALAVGPVGGDGMHPIASWMVAIDLTDALALHRQGEGDASRFAIAFAEDAPVHQEMDWPLSRDLAWRAHALLESHAGRALPVKAVLTKRIPTGAGLGGGSSDAAGMLVGLNALFKLGIALPRLASLGAKLGSDVPFFVHAIAGSPAAIVTGRGDIVSPVPLDQPIHAMLVCPGPALACATGAVYQAFDRLHASTAHRTLDLDKVRRLASGLLRADGPFNDLAAAAFAVQPTLETLARELAQGLGRPVHVTGSGSTLYTLADDDTHARELAITAARQTGLATLAVRSLASVIA